MTEYIPLKTDGSKSPAISGWNKPDYRCTLDEALAQSDWVGMRADDMVIVDCDTHEAAVAFIVPMAQLPDGQRTPRGYHFFFDAVEGSPTGPQVGVRQKVDIRAGRGSYVVCVPSPGYAELKGVRQPYNPAWLDQTVPAPGEGTSSPSPAPGWDVIPDGERNMRLTSILGGIWRQGISQAKFGGLALALNKALCVPPLPSAEVSVLVRSITRYAQEPDESFVIVDDADGELRTPNGEPLLLRASTFTKPPPTTWLWEPYVPDCTLTLATGREGIGKGMFCAYLAACVALGVEPATGEKTEPRTVLWLAAEDDPQLDVWKRLRAAGWDPDTHAEITFLNQRVRMLLPEEEEAFESLLDRENPGLLIMDPGRAYFGRKDGAQISFNNEADVAPALRGLLAISQRRRMPLVFVGHWRKGGGEMRDMTSGTGAWKQIARHCLDFAESDDEEAKAFDVGKTNISTKGHVAGYHMIPVSEWDSAKFVFDGELPFTSLGKWLESATGERIVIDDMDELLAVIEDYDEGRMIPGRPALRGLTGLSEHKLKPLITELQDQGRLTYKPGMGNVWNG